MPTDNPKEHPVYKNQSGAVDMAVWANTHAVDGEQRTFHSIALKRSYLDKEENWQKTDQLRQRDLGDAIALLQTVTPGSLAKLCQPSGRKST
jgi:hypothetical protein